MKAVAAVYHSRSDAEQAVVAAQSVDIPTDKIVVLTPGDIQHNRVSNRLLGDEQPNPIWDVSGKTKRPSDFVEMPSFVTAIPGVGKTTAVGLLGAALLITAGEAAEAFADTRFEDPTIEGLFESEIFLYEEVLRHGGSVLIVIAEEAVADRFSLLARNNGARSIDEIRNQWWSALRGSEQAHYATLKGNFAEDEKFYRLGFEAALHARTRCKEYDQGMGEMNAKLEDVQRQYPNVNTEDPFTRGYERGRNYYQGLCNQCTTAS
jgi:hypothetical protein